MDFLRQQFIVISERLGGLSATQKMLTAALAVIAVMTLLYWGRISSSTEMVPVLPTALAGEDLARVTSSLRARGIEYTTVDGKVMVASARQDEALADIAFNGATPAQATDLFEAMMAKVSPLDSQGNWDARLNNVNERRLENVIARFPGIASATVNISPGQKITIARPQPTAHVAITSKPNSGISKKQFGEGAANAVASSIGIDRAKVGITIDGSPYVVAGADGMAGGMDNGELIDQQLKWERVYKDKIVDQFGDIQGLLVTVTVALDSESMQKTINDVDPTHKFVAPTETITEKSVATGAAPAAEPGMITNTAMAVGGPSTTPLPGSTWDRTEERNTVQVATSVSRISKQAGMGKVLSAAIRVPRAYFASNWKKENPTGGEATGEAFSAYMTAELERMRNVVKQVTMIENEQFVTANPYNAQDAADVMTATGGPLLAAAGGAGESALSVFAAGHAKDVAVGVLALASLFMVGRMVKKSAPAMPEPLLALDGDSTPMTVRAAASGGATAAKVRAANTLHGAEDVAGDVLESGPILMGQELDEAILETSQMVDQVGGFVKDNPEMAAQLVRRWLSRE